MDDRLCAIPLKVLVTRAMVLLWGIRRTPPRLKNPLRLLVEGSAVSDISTLTSDDFSIARNKTASIPAPGGEPIIGVLDTPFDDRVYFADWVE